jgi:hypothetical protein
MALAFPCRLLVECETALHGKQSAVDAVPFSSIRLAMRLFLVEKELNRILH